MARGFDPTTISLPRTNLFSLLQETWQLGTESATVGDALPDSLPPASEGRGLPPSEGRGLPRGLPPSDGRGLEPSEGRELESLPRKLELFPKDGRGLPPSEGLGLSPSEGRGLEPSDGRQLESLSNDGREFEPFPPKLEALPSDV